MDNKFSIKFLARSENEALARTLCTQFTVPVDPDVIQLAELKTAVSEAVTNVIVHAYPNGDGEVLIEGELKNNIVYISIIDNGIGIDNIEKAKEPLYTEKPEEERSGLGFSIMESFCDELYVESKPGFGTKVLLVKRMGKAKINYEQEFNTCIFNTEW